MKEMKKKIEGCGKTLDQLSVLSMAAMFENGGGCVWFRERGLCAKPPLLCSMKYFA